MIKNNINTKYKICHLSIHLINFPLALIKCKALCKVLRERQKSYIQKILAVLVGRKLISLNNYIKI